MRIWTGQVIQHGGQSSHIQFSTTKSTKDKVVKAIQEWLKKDKTLKNGMRWWPKADPMVWGKGSYDQGFGCGPYDISINSKDID